MYELPLEREETLPSIDDVTQLLLCQISYNAAGWG